MTICPVTHYMEEDFKHIRLKFIANYRAKSKFTTYDVPTFVEDVRSSNTLQDLLEKGYTVPQLAYLYAREVLRGPWLFGETAIATSAEWSCVYAAHVLKTRFMAGEAAIRTNETTAYYYYATIVVRENPGRDLVKDLRVILN